MLVHLEDVGCIQEILLKSELFPINSLLLCENTKKNYYNRKKRCKFAENFKNSYNFRNGR